MSTTEEVSWFKSSYSGSEGDNCVEVALRWAKSSYSGDEGDNCVEVALGWAKSSYSGSSGDNCVEVAMAPQAVHVRDSKDTAVSPLTVSPAAWAAFTVTLRSRNVRGR